MTKKILETKRLILETIDDTHLSSLISLLSNKKVHQYFPKALDKNEAMEFYNKLKIRYQNDGIGFWAAIRKSDNVFIGICGLLVQNIEGNDEVEVGYRFLDKYWGRGYATEAAQGCIQFGKVLSPKLFDLICLKKKPPLPFYITTVSGHKNQLLLKSVIK